MKKIIVFNPLKNISVRGISLYSTEYSNALSNCNSVEVKEFLLPKIFSKLPRIFLFFVFFFSQQFVLPVYAAKHKAVAIFDAYNSYSILGSLFFDYKCVIHDFIPFENKWWLLKPGSVYQFVLHNMMPFFKKINLFYISKDVAVLGEQRIHKKYAILPNIVTPLRSSVNHVYDNPELKKILECGFEIVISTISGSGKNKNFDGLIDLLNTCDMDINLIAFGLGECFEKQMGRVKVFSPGFVSSNDIGLSISQSNLFVFHSLSEGFGRPIVEALYEKKVVLAADVCPAIRQIPFDACQNVVVYSHSDFSIQFKKALNKTFIEFDPSYLKGEGLKELLEI